MNARAGAVAPALLEAVDGDLALGQLDLLPAPRELVGALAVDLDGRVGGRALADQAGRQQQVAVGHAARLGDLAVAVAGRRDVRRSARPSRRSSAAPSGTAACASRGRRARAAGRSRTGRACRRGRPSTPRAEPLADRRDDVVRGHAGRLVEEDHPVHAGAASQALRSAARGATAARRPARAGTRRARPTTASWRSRPPGGGRRRPARGRSRRRRRARRWRAARPCASPR